VGEKKRWIKIVIGRKSGSFYLQRYGFEASEIIILLTARITYLPPPVMIPTMALRHTPWATISKVNSGLFVAGDSILFRRGDT